MCVGVFRQGPLEREIIPHGQAEGAGQSGLDGIDRDFAVSLHAVTITDGEQRAFDENGQIKRRACHELLVVEIAAVLAGRECRHGAPRRRRRRPHDPEERSQRNLLAPGQQPVLALAIKHDMKHAGGLACQRPSRGSSNPSTRASSGSITGIPSRTP